MTPNNEPRYQSWAKLATIMYAMDKKLDSK